MARVKPATQAERVAAVRTILDLKSAADETVLAALPIVKGLFSRAYKQDQWDWFTVWLQLGRPGRIQCRAAADALGRARRAFVETSQAGAAEQLSAFRRAYGDKYLHWFLAGGAPAPTGAGYLYILSTREQPRMLKIGFTERSVEVRVKEINAATGVIVPFGVRALWVVSDPRGVEAEVHKLLTGYRVRPDREFFELDFYEACRIIRAYLDAQRLEL